MTGPRRFELIINPADNANYGAVVVETTEGEQRVTAKVSPTRIGAVRSDIVAAAVASGHRRTSVAPTRTKPIALTEEAGVRLTLAILATAPVRRSERIDTIRSGLDAMTAEEVFYWYAHIRGDRSSQALKALRILLAGE